MHICFQADREIPATSKPAWCFSTNLSAASSCKGLASEREPSCWVTSGLQASSLSLSGQPATHLIPTWHPLYPCPLFFLSCSLLWSPVPYLLFRCVLSLLTPSRTVLPATSLPPSRAVWPPCLLSQACLPVSAPRSSFMCSANQLWTRTSLQHSTWMKTGTYPRVLWMPLINAHRRDQCDSAISLHK